MSRNLLIADDEDFVREGLSRYIKTHCPDFEQVYQASDGGEALEMALKYEPCMILLDVQMPVLTGIDVMRQLKQSSLDPIVLILSGFDEFKFAQQAMHYGARDYLIKPVKAQELVDRINELLGSQILVEKKRDHGEPSIIRQSVAYIDDHFSEEISLSIVAEKLGLSASYLSSKFSQEMGINFVDYVNNVRVKHACDYLRRGYYKVYEVSEKVGFHDTKYFAKLFKKTKGMSPKEYMLSSGEDKSKDVIFDKSNEG